jgi:hypothetical protein
MEWFVNNGPWVLVIFNSILGLLVLTYVIWATRNKKP